MNAKKQKAYQKKLAAGEIKYVKDEETGKGYNSGFPLLSEILGIDNPNLDFNFYTIPQELLDMKYHGCGNGCALFDPETGTMIDFNYMEDGLVINDQNVEMTEDAGEILKTGDDSFIAVKCNFSCCQAVLF